MAMYKRPEIVAELSCNHGGSLVRALELVDAAFAAGADGIKVQCWEPEHMVLDKDYRLTKGPWSGRTLFDLYEEAHTPWDWIPAIFERAKLHRMAYLASVFDPEALRYLEDIGCPRYKISSFELVDLPLIEAVRATGKPMILSTGMADDTEIWQALKAAGIHHRGAHGLAILHCVSEYPAPPHSMRLQAIPTMRLEFGVPVGLSDHTLGSAVAIAATAFGACMIEKHFTLRRSEGGPDASFSMEPLEFRRLVDQVEIAHQASAAGVSGPDGGYCVNPGDLLSQAPQALLRRSLHFNRDLPAGAVLDPDAIRSARPATGVAPRHLAAFVGATLVRPVKRGQPVSWEDIDQPEKIR